MARAIELARRGAGFVEPNPQVGAVLVDDNLRLIAEGYHGRFGGPHAEIRALQEAGERSRGATLVVTLEPCCHHGKTPPCADAVIRAGIRRVIVGMQDPFPAVSGRGIEQLRQAGIDVEVGLLEDEVRRLNGPFQKLIRTGMPWVHAKWAMTLDGKIASRTGESKWISNEASRAIVHQLRARMDAIVIGSGTALADDPLLTARPPGPRVATRVVLDRRARLPIDSQLARTVNAAPVLLVVGRDAPAENLARLRSAEVEVWQGENSHSPGRDGPALKDVLLELGRRKFTNVLVEGGSELLGALFDERLIDEVHVFIAPKLLGGAEAKSPFAGLGLSGPSRLPDIDRPAIELLEGDVYVHGPVKFPG